MSPHWRSFCQARSMQACLLPLLPAQAAQLKGACSHAPFGRGENTIVYNSVRNALQLCPNQFQLTAPGDDVQTSSFK